MSERPKMYPDSLVDLLGRRKLSEIRVLVASQEYNSRHVYSHRGSVTKLVNTLFPLPNGSALSSEMDSSRDIELFDNTAKLTPIWYAMSQVWHSLNYFKEGDPLIVNFPMLNGNNDDIFPLVDLGSEIERISKCRTAQVKQKAHLELSQCAETIWEGNYWYAFTLLCLNPYKNGLIDKPEAFGLTQTQVNQMRKHKVFNSADGNRELMTFLTEEKGKSELPNEMSEGDKVYYQRTQRLVERTLSMAEDLTSGGMPSRELVKMIADKECPIENYEAKAKEIVKFVEVVVKRWIEARKPLLNVNSNKNGK